MSKAKALDSREINMKLSNRLIGVTALYVVSASVIAGTINYEGSSTVGKFITDASKVYTASSFKINTVPESLGGEQCAARGKCEMGGVARDVSQKFLDRGVVATLIGKDALAAIVNANNPVTGLSSEQLKGIFTGKIKNWSEVGGEDLPIKPLVVKNSSATRHIFAKAILGGENYKGVKVVTPDAKMVRVVSRDKRTIGQLSFAFLIGKKGIKAIRVDGQEASVNNPNYPITRNLHIATKGEPQGEVKAFLEWALSPEGQKVLKQRFVSDQ
jgi:phosphate transport system substrate-binding protein